MKTKSMLLASAFAVAALLCFVTSASAQTTFLNEGFNGTADGILPTNWSTVNNGTSDHDWGVVTTFPSSSNTLGGGKFVLVNDAINILSPSQANEFLYTPAAMDITTTSQDVWLFYKQHIYAQQNISGTARFVVQVYNGSAWITVDSVNMGGSTLTVGGWGGLAQAKSINVSAYKNANFQVRYLAHISNLASGYWAVDSVVVKSVLPDIDLDITGLTAPTSNVCNIGLASIVFDLANLKSEAAPIASYNVKVSIDDGATWSTESGYLQVNGFGNVSYTFGTQQTFITGENKVVIVAKHPNDLDASNDTARFSVWSQPLISTFPYLQDFEASAGYWSTGGANSSWAWGAETGYTNVWSTGLNAPHNPFELSYVESPCFDFSGLTMVDPVFEMDLSVTTTLGNGASLYYNSGSGWKRVGSLNDNTPPLYTFNWYNTPVINLLGGAGWSSQPSGSTWTQKVSHVLSGLKGQSNVKFRIYFGANSNGAAGVVFDNVKIYEPFWVDMDDLTRQIFVILRGQSVELGATVGGMWPQSKAAYKFRWSPKDSIDQYTAPDSSRILTSPLETTTYTVSVTDDDTKYTIVAYGTVIVVDTFTVVAKYDAVVCDTAKTVLKAYPSGGVGPYTYAWGPTATLQAPFNLQEVTSLTHNNITYTVTVTDANGFTATDNVSITVVSGFPVVDIEPNFALMCKGDSVQLFALGGVTYSWYSNPPGAYISQTNIANPWVIPSNDSTTTVFYVNTTSPCGNASTFINIDTKPLPPKPSLVIKKDSVCVDATPFSIETESTFSPAGGTFTGTGISYGFFDPALAGVGKHYITYSYVGPNGCSNFAIDSIQVYPLPNLCKFDIYPGTPGSMFPGGQDTVCLGEVAYYDIDCDNQDVKYVDIDGSGGKFITGWTINWAITGGTVVFNYDQDEKDIRWDVVGDQVITATITNTFGCDTVLYFNVHVNPLPNFNIANAGSNNLPAVVKYCAGAPDSLFAYFNVGGFGFGPYTYNWYNKNNTAPEVFLSSATYLANTNFRSGFGLPAENPNKPDTVRLRLNIYDASTQCSNNDTVTLIFYPTPVPGLNPDPLQICLNECDTIKSTGKGHYVWSSNISWLNADSTKAVVCGSKLLLDTVNVYVTVTDQWNNGCVAYDSVLVQVQPLPAIFNIQPQGLQNFCAGTAGVKIWLDSSALGFRYQLMINNAVSGAAVLGDGDSISFGFRNLDGLYKVVATDTLTGCVDTMNGRTTLDADTLKVVIWAEFSKICAGFETLLRVDFPGPDDTTGYGKFNFSWTTPQWPVLNYFTPNGYGTGQADPPSSLDSTRYDVTVTGVDPLCVATATKWIKVDSLPVPAILNGKVDTTICSGSSVTLTTGVVYQKKPPTSGVSYLWTPATGLSSATVLSPIASPTVNTTYILRVTDNQGCVGEDTITVKVNPSPAFVIYDSVTNAQPTDLILCPGETIALTTNTITGGTAPYQWSFWVNGVQQGGWFNTVAGPRIPTKFLSPAVTTTYMFQVRDAFGCITSRSVTVTVAPVPTVDVNGPITVCQTGNANLLAIPSGGTAPYGFLWSNSVNNAPVIAIPQPTVANPIIPMAGNAGIFWFPVVVTDSNGCKAYDSVNVISSNNPVAFAGPDDVICEGSSYTLFAQGGPTYQWTKDSVNGAVVGVVQSVVVSPVVTTTYWLTTNSSCGVATSRMILTVVPKFDVDFTGLATEYCEEDAAVTLTAVPPTPAGVHLGIGVFTSTGLGLVDNGDSTATFDPGVAGPGTWQITYTFTDTVTGCAYSKTYSTIVRPTPVVTLAPISPVCVDAPVFTLTGGAPVPPPGTAYYTVNGVVKTSFNAAVEGVGSHTVKYVYTSQYGCTDSAWVTVVVNPIPTNYTLYATSPTNGNYYCAGDTATLYLSGSQIGATYRLFMKPPAAPNFSAIGDFAGTGGLLNFGKYFAGEYYVYAFFNQTGCDQYMPDTVKVIEAVRPEIYVVEIENCGHYCAGGTGVDIWMRSTNTEDRYYLYRGVTLVDSVNGAAINGDEAYFPGNPYTVAGIYSVIAKDLSTPAKCASNMSNTVTVVIDPKPIRLPVTIPVLCHCPGSGTPITVGNSTTFKTQLNTDYVLMFGATPVDTLPGNGTGSITFAPVSPVGVYHVMAYKYSSYGPNCSTICVDSMQNTVTVCQYEYVEITNFAYLNVGKSTMQVNVDGGDIFSMYGDATGSILPSPNSYRWQLSQNGGATWTDTLALMPYVFNGINTDSLSFQVVYPDMKGWMFRWIVQGRCNNDTSDIVKLNVYPNTIVSVGPYGAKAELIQCADNVEVPIWVYDFDSIQAASLSLKYDTSVLVYDGYASAHPAIVGTGILAVNGFDNLVNLAYTSFGGNVNIGDAILIVYKFHFKSTAGGFSTLNWNTDPGTNELSTYIGTTAYDIDATFINGSVEGIGLPVPNASINPNPICENETLYLSASPYGPNVPISGLWQGPNGFISSKNDTFILGVKPGIHDGVYTFTAFDATNLVCDHDTSITVVIYPVPDTFNVTGGGTACFGSGVEIGVSGSQAGVKYYLYKDGYPYTQIGYPPYIVNGTGGAITFGPVSLSNNGSPSVGTGTFQVLAIDTTHPTLCETWMTGNATITITPLPFIYTAFTINNGHYCADGDGLPIFLTGSQQGVRYDLWYAPYCCCQDTIVATLFGTGSYLNFGLMKMAGTYNVVATNVQTGCVLQMTGCVDIRIDPVPTAAVSGGGNVCLNEPSPQIRVDLTGTKPWKIEVNNGQYVYSNINATPFFFTVPTNVAGTFTYNVTRVVSAPAYGATDSCDAVGTGTATVVVYPKPTLVVSSNSPRCVGDTIKLFATGSVTPGPYTYQWAGPNGFTSALQNPVILNAGLVNAGYYKVTVTDNLGCNKVDSTQVTIWANPVAYALGDEVCYGDTICVSGSLSQAVSIYQISSYAWTGPAGFTSKAADTCIFPATAAKAGEYILTIVDIHGCKAKDTATVIVNALPIANAGPDVAICYGDSTILTATGGIYYLWSTGANTASITVKPSVTTTYTVTVTDVKGCKNTDAVVVTVNPLPEKYLLERNGVYCFGCNGIPVWLVDSDTLTTYVLYKDGLPFDTLQGTGSMLSFGLIEDFGVFSVQATNNVTGCKNWMLNTILIQLRAAPLVEFTVDTLDICYGTCDSLEVYLTGIPPFQLHFTNAMGVVTLQASDITPIGFEQYSWKFEVCDIADAEYGISLIEDSVCFRTGDTAYVDVLPLPVKFDVVGGGYYCNVGVFVGLAGSNVGINYVLYVGSTPIDTLAGTGFSLNFGPQTQVGNYTVLAYNVITGCSTWMNGTAEIWSGILPYQFTITGGGFYCAGDSVQIGLSGSELNVTYQLLINTGVQILPVATKIGTGSPISFGYFKNPGVYNVQGVNNTTLCLSVMLGTTTVGIRPLPTATISGTATICKGQNAMLTVNLTGTPPFDIYLSNGDFVTNWPNFVWTQNVSPLVTTTYTVVNVVDEYCHNTGTGSAVITVNSPTKFNITGGGVYCEGGIGLLIGLSGSQTGVTYQLLLNGGAAGAPVAGTGSPINFGYQLLAGTYTIIATQNVTGCQDFMNGSATITVNPLPKLFNVWGGGDCCIGCTILYLGVDSSEYGIRYKLYKDGVPYGNPNFPDQFGTLAGDSIVWGYMTQEGTYTILAINDVTGCSRFMSGSAIVVIYDEPSAVVSGDAIICNNETADITINMTGIPPFNLLIRQANGGPANDTIISNILGYSYVYTTPVLSAGTYVFTVLDVRDSLCFSYGTGSATIIVKPNPAVTIPNYNNVCVDVPAFTLTGGLPTGGIYYVNNVVATVFDPAAVGVGTHAVKYFYTDTFNCPNFAIDSITVYPLPTCTFTHANVYCVDALPDTLKANNNGGTFSAPGAPTGTIVNLGNGKALFKPAVAGVGVWTVAYEYTNANGCFCSVAYDITVTNLPNVSFTGLGAAYCLDDAIVTLTGSPAGGSFSGPGITNLGGGIASFNPSVAGVGTKSITYNYSTGLCANTSTQTTVVNALPLVYNLTGGGFCCVGCQLPVGLAGSQTGVQYALFVDGVFLNQVLNGTGAALNFGDQNFPGVYTITATNLTTGCVSEMDTTVSIQFYPVTTATMSGNTSICAGDDATINVALTGVPPFTILVSDGVTSTYYSNINTFSWSMTVSPSVTTIYSVLTVSDINCFNFGTGTSTVTVLPVPTEFSVTGGGSYCAGGNGVAVGLSGSQSGVFYTLYNNNVATATILAGNGSALNFGAQLAGVYTVMASGTGYCEKMMGGSATVVQNALPTVLISASATTVCAGIEVSLGASGADTYVWSGGLGTNASVNVTPLVTTTYTVTGTYTNTGCSNTATVTITVNPLPVVNAIADPATICVGASSVLTASSATATSFSWSDGLGTGATKTVSPTATESYTVTGTDVNGCSNTATVTVTVNPIPQVGATAQPSTICAGSTSVLTATGAGTYAWSNGGTGATINVTPAVTTTYTVTGTLNGCSSTAQVTVIVNPVPTVAASASPATICAGSTSVLTATGATTYAWSNGGTGASINVTPAVTTTYTVTGTANGCSSTAQVTVTVNPLPVVNATATPSTICVGSSSTLNATGADSYVWSTGGTGASINVTPGATTTYTVTGTTNGCSSTAQVTVFVNPIPQVGASAQLAIICAGETSVLTATGAGTYAWSNGGTGATINVTPSVTTTYTVTGTLNGCSSTAQVTVTVKPVPVVGASPSPATICAGESSTLTATGADTYVWSNSLGTGATKNVTPAATTTYTVTGTTNGCSSTAQVTVVVNTKPTVTANATPATVCAGTSSQLVAGGASTYAWSNGLGSGATKTVTPMATTTYTVTGTSTNGCTNTASVTVVVNPVPSVTLPASVNITLGSSYVITPVVSGGTGSYTYLWTPGGATTPTLTVSPTDTTVYSVVVSDGNCSASASIQVNVLKFTGVISGVVTYKNAAATPMTNTQVKLMQGATVLATVTTNANGQYTFPAQFSGSYTVVAAPTKPWGGANSNDALLTLQEFIGGNTGTVLSGLNKLAANVNGDAIVNSSDALLIAQRFTTIITSFTVGDWVSDANTVVIPGLGGPVTNNFNVLCFGDVNGSFTPAAKQASTIEIKSNGVKEIKSFQEFDLPVMMGNAQKVGAISLVLDYPEDAVEVLDVLIGGAASTDLIYTDKGGVLRISWYNNTVRDLKTNDALVTLKMRAKDLSYVSSKTIEIYSSEESQLGDGSAVVLRNVSLNIPKLVVAVGEYSVNVYPNPFSEKTTIEYTMPENGNVTLKVFNALGEQVKVLSENKAHNAGTYNVEFDATQLTPGTYTYRIEVTGEVSNFMKTGMMVLTK